MFFLNFLLVFSLAFWPFGEPSTPATGLKKTALTLPSDVEALSSMRILVLKNVSEVTAEISSPYQVKDETGQVLFEAQRLPLSKIVSRPDGIQIGPRIYSVSPVKIESQGEGVRLGKYHYRQALQIWRDSGGKLMFVNEIDMDSYLKGVLPVEANPKWPMESLRVQAIVARTYALFKSIENQRERFVVSKDVMSQVYAGKNAERTPTNLAVEMTRGQILTYQGKIFPAYFHSTCGGATTHGEYVWNVEPNPVLKGVLCNFCRDSKHYRWESAIASQDIATKLRKGGFRISGITNIIPEEMDETGRAKFFRVQYDGGEVKIQSNDFRLWVDPMNFKSTFILSVERDGNRFVFKGRGWGHGVGLCQYGMNHLAELGYTRKQILEYYYPGAEITEI